MKAVVYERYGPPEVLRLTDVEQPAPGDGDVVVRVHATTVSIADVKLRTGVPFAVRLYNGLLRPGRVKILGMELGGVIASAGRKVRRFKEGDQVFALTGFGFGAHAEYARLPEAGTAARGGLLAPKPVNATFEEAAAIPGGGITALVVLRKADIRSGQKVLIYGASGAVGTAAVQLAKAFGATVTGVCSTVNLDLVRSLGADEVIDYTRQDFARSGETYDVVFDAVDKLRPSQARRPLRPGGMHLNVVRNSGSGRVIQTEALVFLKDLIEAGQLRAVIDRRYTFEQIRDAHAYVEQGHKRGSVVVTPTHGPSA